MRLLVCLSVITKLDFPGNLCRAASQFLWCYYLFSPKPQNKVKLKVAAFFRARKTCNYLTSSIEVIKVFFREIRPWSLFHLSMWYVISFYQECGDLLMQNDCHTEEWVGNWSIIIVFILTWKYRLPGATWICHILWR